nr:unnamed protein product [Digitaria exilis]
MEGIHRPAAANTTAISSNHDYKMTTTGSRSLTTSQPDLTTMTKGDDPRCNLNEGANLNPRRTEDRAVQRQTTKDGDGTASAASPDPARARDQPKTQPGSTPHRSW